MVESSSDEESLGEDASKQGRIDAIDADEEIILVSVQNVDEEMFDVNVLDGEEVFVAEQEVTANKENDKVNVVKEVVEVISAAGNVISNVGDATTISAATATTDNEELGESTTTKSLQLSSQQSQDKGKGIMIEPVKPMKKKDQISFDEETAKKLQAEFDEEERLAREKAEKEKEANIALIETWDDIQAKIDVDHQLAERLQAQEQEELSVEEKATLFQQLLEKRRKHFAAKRAEEKRNKPPTKAQQRQIMCTYLKNMEGYKLKDLKSKGFDSIQEMFDRAFKRVNTFEDFRTELVEGKEKRAGTELIQENAKKQKVEDDKETTKLKQCLEIIPDEEEVTIDAIPLAVKSPSIVGWKIHKEGRKSYYSNNERLLVKAKYESTRPVEDLDLLLWGDLKTMFKPHVEDTVWRNQQDSKVLDWKLYDSCGVHSLRMIYAYLPFDDVQARMDAYALLAARLQEEEREQFSIDEQARFLVDTITERKRFTYNQLKNKSLEEIHKLYKMEQKWINDFVPMDYEMVKDNGKKDDDSQKQSESSKKRPRAEHDEESVKKQKLKDNVKKEELKACLDIVPRDDIVINVESLATKYPIVDWKTHILTENIMYYQIIRADESSKNYKIFSEMLDDFDKRDVVDLYSLVKERIAIHVMVEKKYPLTQEMLSRMLNRRLEVDHESTMAFELIRFIKAQLEE
ncbi:hypothetical protein Tco_0687905 [Tanacetum coccineum]